MALRQISLLRWLATATTCFLACELSTLGAKTKAEERASSRTLDRVTLQLKWRHQFQFAGYYAAQIKGFYREAGLAVELIEARPGDDPVDSVLKGKADFGVGTSELVLLRAKGAPVVVLAAVFQHSPLVLIARGAGAETDLQALHDRPMMIEPQSAELFAYFRNEGINPERLNIVHHTFSADDLVSGKVAAMSGYSTDEPYLLQQSGIEFSVFSPRAGGIDFYGDNLFTVEGQLRAHPERVKAFRAASLRGWEYALAHPDEIIDHILSLSDRKGREHLRFEAERTAQLMHPGLIEVGHMNPGRWRHIADTYAEFGMVQKEFPLEGMLYEADPRFDPRKWYWVFGAAGALAIAALGWIAPLVRLNRRLRRGERQYRQLAENAPFPVVITDIASGRLMFANRLAGEMMGEPAEALFARPAVSFYADPADREALIAELVAGRPVAAREIKLKGAGGRDIWALLSAGVVEFDGHRGIVVAFHDVTGWRAMQDQLRGAKDEAESANAVRSRYLAVMSHEIRTPMNGIQGLTELMLADGEILSADQRENLEMMRAASRSLLRLVNELLDWSQLEAGSVSLEAAPLVVADFARHLAGLFRPATEAKGVTLAVELSSAIPPVIVTDSLRLRQILSNLLSNAAKFTERGRVGLAIEAEPGPTKTERRIRFVVTDTGPGIPPAVQEKLFAPYVQADPSVVRRFGGSGLGLSISRGLARLLGGDILLRSVEGEGSTFTLEIVARVPDEAS